MGLVWVTQPRKGEERNTPSDTTTGSRMWQRVQRLRARVSDSRTRLRVAL